MKLLTTITRKIMQDNKNIPERVKAHIQNKQITSEKIISWMQLFIVSTFATLYALSPETEYGPVMFLKVIPYVLTIYLIFTCIRLYLVYKKHLTPWLLVLSCALDVATLYFILWSFSIQYAQPPSFILKAPTLLYIFIFITLRALRFDFIYVFITGAFAIIGWLIVVEHILSVEGMQVITRDYIAYMTSNKVLIGAEFDKIISMLFVTGILIVASIRSRALLFQAIKDNLARTDMSRFFTADVADRIVDSSGNLSAGYGERLNASVLNVDIRGFTKLSAQMKAAELMTLLSEYQGKVVPIIEKHGGNIDKFMGDGIMATFGTAQNKDAFARNALESIPEILKAVEGINAMEAPLRIGLAVATGELIYGVIGSEDRLEYTSIGEPVNLSAKLDKYNSEQGTRAVCDRATLELARQQGLAADYPCEARENQTVTGVAEPMEVIVLQK